VGGAGVRTTFPVAAPPEAWAALVDPDRLAAALPGCRTASRAEGGTVLAVDLDVASVRGLWSGTVAPLDADAVRIQGSGEPGTVDLVVRAAPDRTSLTVEGDVGGPLAAVGGAVLAAAVRRLAEATLAAAVPPPAVSPGPRAAPSAPRRRRSWLPAAAAAAGAVAVAAAAGRRHKRSGRRNG
jgi:carbon monoxide dehydrogenase subunit G